MIMNLNIKIAFFVLLVAVVSNAANQKPKNVLFIVADDLGMILFRVQLNFKDLPSYFLKRLGRCWI